MILFPAIDLKGGQCVRLLQGKADAVTVYSDNPVAVAEEWQRLGAEFLHLVDLDGAFTGQPRNSEWVERIAKTLKIPVQLGGGLRTPELIQQALGLGVSRVVIGTKAASEGFVRDVLEKVRPDQIVVGIDAKDGKVAIAGWTEKTLWRALDFAQYVAAVGVKRIVFTDISTDGMLTGPPLRSLKDFCSGIDGCSVIASGGVGSLEDLKALRQLQQDGARNLEGVIVGKALYEKKFTLPQALAAME